MNEQIDQTTLTIIKACNGQNATLIVSGLGRVAYSCIGTLHVEDGKIRVFRDRDGWRHSLGIDVASLRSLEATTRLRGLLIEARIGVCL